MQGIHRAWILAVTCTAIQNNDNRSLWRDDVLSDKQISGPACNQATVLSYRSMNGWSSRKAGLGCPPTWPRLLVIAEIPLELFEERLATATDNTANEHTSYFLFWSRMIIRHSAAYLGAV